jgi:hypothetical protein
MSSRHFIQPGAGTADPVRQLAGSRAHAVGDVFEAWCEHQHALAEARGLIVHPRHVSPKIRVLGKNRDQTLRVRIVGKAGADWIAQLPAAFGGRIYRAESKTTELEDPRDEPTLARSAFLEHQVEELDATVANAGLAAVLWEVRAPGHVPRRFGAPWPLAWEKAGRGYSVTAASLRAWEVRAGECYVERLLVDFGRQLAVSDKGRSGGGG